MSHRDTTNLRPSSQAGASLFTGRAANEYYPTPPEVTRALLSVETFHGSVWEPACGEGWMAEEFKHVGYEVIATDLVEYGYGRGNFDFLKSQTPLAKNIITNPPYGSGLADKFLRHALTMIEQTGGRVAMLLNLSSLCHPSRHDSFTRRPPSVIYALDECVCYPNGKPDLATSRTYDHRYYWGIWDTELATETKMKWLSTRPFQ